MRASPNITDPSVRSPPASTCHGPGSDGSRRTTNGAISVTASLPVQVPSMVPLRKPSGQCARMGLILGRPDKSCRCGRSDDHHALLAGADSWRQLQVTLHGHFACDRAGRAGRCGVADEPAVSAPVVAHADSMEPSYPLRRVASRRWRPGRLVHLVPGREGHVCAYGPSATSSLPEPARWSSATLPAAHRQCAPRDAATPTRRNRSPRSCSGPDAPRSWTVTVTAGQQVGVEEVPRSNVRPGTRCAAEGLTRPQAVQRFFDGVHATPERAVMTYA